MKRREFVRRLPIVTTGLAVGATPLVSGCSGVPYVSPAVGPTGLAFPADSLGPDGDVFVQAPDMERPVYVRRDEAGRLSAVLAACTHRGCQPERVGDRLACPCHGSEFTFDGEVITGPATEPLARYAIEEAGGEIRVRVPGGRP